MGFSIHGTDTISAQPGSNNNRTAYLSYAIRWIVSQARVDIFQVKIWLDGCFSLFRGDRGAIESNHLDGDKVGISTVTELGINK